MKHRWSILLLLVTAALGADSFEAFGHKWSVPHREDWQLDTEAGAPVLHLLTGREPLPGPRRPYQFALADTADLLRVKVEADLKPLRRSLMIVFAYHDSAHFDYAHLSTDIASKQPVHNGVFHVYGGERVRISSDRGPASFTELGRWYHVVVQYDGATGEINVTVDGKPVPSLHAVDVSLGAGKVGIGSFNETGDFKAVKITGL